MDTEFCEFCSHALTPDTRATAFGLLVCGNFDACLSRQAAVGDGEAADLLAIREKRQAAQAAARELSGGI